MAVALDTAVNGGNATATSLTYSHTCAAAAYLLVGVVGDVSGNDKVTGVTYGGIPMLFIGKVLGNAGGASRDIYLYGLAGAPSGANNVVVSASASIFIAAVSASYTGVNQQSNVPDNAVSGVNAATASFALSLTPVADKSWLVMFARNDVGAPSAGAGTTMRANAATGSLGIGDNNAAVSPPASTTLTFTQSSTAWSGIICSLAPLFLLTPPAQQRNTLLRM